MKSKSVSPPNAQRNGKSAVRGLLVTALMLISVIALVSMGPTNVAGWEPHIMTGTIYEANGTVVVNCTAVNITNTRTGESVNTTGNVTGVYAYNLLNLPSGWSYGDTIQVTAWNATNVSGTNSTQIKLGFLTTSIDVWIGTIQAVSGVNFYIVDEDGNEMSGVYINIKDISGNTVTTKMTDSDGKASTDLSNGLYTITVTKSGYGDETKTVRVHGCTYAIRLGDEEVIGIVTGDIWWWAMILLSIVGVIAILAYVAKKA